MEEEEEREVHADICWYVVFLSMSYKTHADESVSCYFTACLAQGSNSAYALFQKEIFGLQGANAAD